MDKKELLKRLNKRGVIVRYDENGCAYVSVPVGNVPIQQFEEWESRCRQEFKGNRWATIWNDYMRIKNFDLQVEVEAMRQMVNDQPVEQEREVENENPLGLLGG